MLLSKEDNVPSRHKQVSGQKMYIPVNYVGNYLDPSQETQ